MGNPTARGEKLVETMVNLSELTNHNKGGIRQTLVNGLINMKKQISPTESDTAQLDYKAIFNHCELIRRFNDALRTCSVLFFIFYSFRRYSRSIQFANSSELIRERHDT